MDHVLQQLRIAINPRTFVKDPQSSELGKRIVEHGIAMISEIGFEQFNFRKLGERIGSNESSIYRYFENKHMFLMYITSWYWGWLEYRLVLTTFSISGPKEKLEAAIEVLTRPVEVDTTFAHVNEVALNRIVVNEYSKAFLTKEVDKENKEGYFKVYKRLVARLGDMIGEVKKDYPYAKSLASAILEGSHHQYFLKEHFPSLTDCSESGKHADFFKHLVFATLA